MIERELHLEGWSRQCGQLIPPHQLRHLEQLTATRLVVLDDRIQIVGTPTATRQARDLLRAWIISQLLEFDLPQQKQQQQVQVNFNFAKNWKQRLLRLARLWQRPKKTNV